MPQGARFRVCVLQSLYHDLVQGDCRRSLLKIAKAICMYHGCKLNSKDEHFFRSMRDLHKGRV